MTAVVKGTMEESTTIAAGRASEAEDRATLTRYARDTWNSFDLMTGTSGLPADGLFRRGDSHWEASAYTSPTNIACYLWSTLGAERLGFIDDEEANRRVGQTLASLARLERAQGFYFNWYDPKTGETLRTWPGAPGSVLRPFLSTVDNGWLAVALMLVSRARPEFGATARSLLGAMDFGFFYDRRPGLLCGGAWADGSLAPYYYGMLNSEARIASYLGIGFRQLPPQHYFRLYRASELGGPSPVPTSSRMYLGVPVPRGVHTYRGLRVVPTWDGTMFEALMVPLFVPEAEWGPRSWGVNHPLYVRGQLEYGLEDAKLGYWGMSTACDPDDGYRAYGVAALGAGAIHREHSAIPEAVVTPHASFLALPFAPDESIANLRRLEQDFPVYGPCGFLDSVDVRTGKVSDRMLSLDQGMVMAAAINALADGYLQELFRASGLGQLLEPLLEQEVFDAGLAGPDRADSAGNRSGRDRTTASARRATRRVRVQAPAVGLRLKAPANPRRANSLESGS